MDNYKSIRDDQAAAEVVRLIKIMRKLRDPDGGCPWDLEQNFDTIVPYTIEEAYEVADAIERRDWTGLKGELGDLLLQSIYHAQMADEFGMFDFQDVACGIADKMVDRHPHVFGEFDSSRTATEQESSWEESKAHERAQKSEVGTLDGIAKALPALTRANKLQKRAATIGFDWPDSRGAAAKIKEELKELRKAIKTSNSSAMEEELGDLLFSCVNLARHLGIDPEGALRAANTKFVGRFEAMEEMIRSEGRKPADLELDELDRYWDHSKSAA